MLGDLANGALPGHNVTGTNILVNSPVNNTEYACVFLDAGNQMDSDPACIVIAGEFNTYIAKCQLFVIVCM